MVSHEHVKDIIVNLIRVSEEFQLIINPKKSGIFLVKDHDRMADAKIEDIPIVT